MRIEALRKQLIASRSESSRNLEWKVRSQLVREEVAVSNRSKANVHWEAAQENHTVADIEKWVLLSRLTD